VPWNYSARSLALTRGRASRYASFPHSSGSATAGAATSPSTSMTCSQEASASSLTFRDPRRHERPVRTRVGTCLPHAPRSARPGKQPGTRNSWRLRAQAVMLGSWKSPRIWEISRVPGFKSPLGHHGGSSRQGHILGFGGAWGVLALRVVTLPQAAGNPMAAQGFAFAERRGSGDRRSHGTTITSMSR
jgi:hypothetical protein